MRQRLLFLLIYLAFSCISFAQPDIRIFAEKTRNGYTIFGANHEYCPVSLTFNFNLINLTWRNYGQNIFVMPARTARFKITELEVTNPSQPHQYSYNYRMQFGDVIKGKPDSTFVYDLPFATGTGFQVMQGYNGSFSHQQQHALDFAMDDSTVVVAARDGVVVNVVEEFDIACTNPGCSRYNNFVLVYHTDGSFASYLHIRKDGSLVSKGDKVKKGQVIALSGNTGFSSRPHLHFECYLATFDGKQTFPTLFRTGIGDVQEYLQQHKLYLRNY